MENAARRDIIHRYMVFFTHRRKFPIQRCTQVRGQDKLSAHIKSKFADKLVRAWPEIALIYGVITEFCCSIDMPGLSVLRSLCTVNNNEAVGPRRQAEV